MKILSMTLENFQGIKSFKFSPDGDSVSIFGDNGTGKTTIYNAFCWLMYGKPSTAEKNFTPQTVGTHNLNHVVEMTIRTDDDRLVTLRKDYHEVYKTKRGEADKVFAGCTTDHFIDGVPVREKDYLSVMEDLIKSDEAAKVLTRYNYFLEDMAVKERRSLLLDVCGDISVADIVASDPKFERLYSVIGHHSLDDYMKIAAAERKKINDELKEIPSRIDELNKTLPNATGLNEEDLLKDRESISASIKDLLEQKASVASSVNADINKQIAQVHADCANAKAEHTNHYNEVNKAVNEDLSRLKSEYSDLEHKKMDQDYKLSRIQMEIETMERDRRLLLDEWDKIKDQEWTGDTKCPTCGQDLPAERIEQFEANFNADKSRKLEEINAKGAAVDKTKIAEKKIEMAAMEQELFKLRTALDEAKARIKAKEAEFEQEIPFDRTPFDKRIAELMELQNNNRASIDAVTADISEKIEKAEDELSSVDSLLAQIKVTRAQKERITELMNRQKELAADAETVAMNIKLCEDFNRKKAELLNDKINSRFKTLQFRLFKELNNGGIEDDCEALIPCGDALVPFKAANNAARINAGLEVIDALSGHYGLSLPVFIDNAEGCTAINPTKAQQIRLYVSEKDKFLRVS